MMMPHRVLYDRSRTLRSLAVATLALCVTALPALASGHHYVLRDGTKVELTESSTEMGVVLRSSVKASSLKTRLRATGRGMLSDIKEAPDARMKLLTLPAGVKPSRAAVMQDRGVRDVGRVFRFAGSTVPVFSTGSIVVRVAAGMTPEEEAQLFADFNLVDVTPLGQIADIYRATPRDSGVDEVTVAELLADDARTVWANPDFRRLAQTTQVGAGDPLLSRQWHLNNTGAFGGVVDADIDAVEAWSVADGSGVIFGMFDDSCDVAHPDLAPNYIGIGQDLTLIFNNDDLAGADDPSPKNSRDAHGTAVMGLAVAAANGVGVRGVAFNARFTASRGLGEFISDFALASAYSFAIQQNVDVHINSWGFIGGIPNPPIIVDAIETAFLNGRDLDGPGGDPPLGMVILFASGNANSLNTAGFELSTLSSVIGVGATNDQDARASYSNFGPDIDIMAPSIGRFTTGIATTDTTDGGVADGYNRAGSQVDPDFGFFLGADIEPTGNYTGGFGGTSAACPIAAGVAGLILSVNPRLTATQVRLILEHTTDKVSPRAAGYNGTTGRSFKYGYGRINADAAVRAAQASLETNDNVWPDMPARINVAGDTLNWRAPVGTDEFLVLESTQEFSFVPEDGACYSTLQAGCESATSVELPDNVSPLFIGCGGDCSMGSRESAVFDVDAGGRKFFALYSKNSLGQYSFGVGIDSLGNEAGGGETLGIDDDDQPLVRPPAVTVQASPLEGRSPLTVRFNGNAVSEFGIDKSRTAWDFDVADAIAVDTDKTLASHVYTVPAGETRTFTARLSVFDIRGNGGASQVSITVTGAAEPEAGQSVDGVPNVRVVVGRPGVADSDAAEGASPFDVELIVASDSSGGAIQSVLWDLGDGSQASSLVVPHTYINDSGATRNYVAVATVSFQAPDGGTVTEVASRVITVGPGTDVINVVDPVLPGTTPLGDGGSVSPCGAMGMIPLMLSTLGLVSVRTLRRGRRRKA